MVDYQYEKELQKLEANLQPFLRPGFFFVNIGASDGIVADPIYPFIEKYSWKGILVEPVPYVFAQLKANYRDLPGMIFENVAVSAEQHETFYFIEDGSGSIDYVMKQIGSLDRDRVVDTINRLRRREDHISRRPPIPPGLPGPSFGVPVHDGRVVQDDLDEHICEIDIDCLSFNDLMEKHAVDRVDFLNIDTEGHDLEIFYSIDLDRYRPQVLCIEITGYPEADLKDLSRCLESRGFVPLQSFALHSRIWVQSSPRRV